MGDDYQGQCWRALFLWKEGVPLDDTHHCLTAVCKDTAPSCATMFQWIQNFKDVNESAEKRVSTGRPRMSCTSDMIQQISNLIIQSRHVTLEQLLAETSLCLATLFSIIGDSLKMRKLCSQWVPHNMTRQQKQARIDSCLHWMMPVQWTFLFVWWLVMSRGSAMPYLRRSSRPCNDDIMTVLIKKRLDHHWHVENNLHRSFGTHKESCSSTGFLRVRQWTATPTVTLWHSCAAKFSSRGRTSGPRKCSCCTTMLACTRANRQGPNWMILGTQSTHILPALQI